MKNFKKIALSLVLVLCVFLLFGCNFVKAEDASASNNNVSINKSGISDGSAFTNRDYETAYDENTAIKVFLADGATTSTSKTVEQNIKGNDILLTQDATYILSGKLTDGSVTLSFPVTAKPQIVFDGVEITSSKGAGIYVESCKKLFITLNENTDNVIRSTYKFDTLTDTIDGALFSKEDLTINGSGSLTVESLYGHGIVSKDDLAITDGKFTVISALSGLNGNDCVKIDGGEFKITSKTDGIHAENLTDTTLGNVEIYGGKFEINSTCDGISASSVLTVESGIFNIDSTLKGLKGVSAININGGEITCVSVDDAVHSNGNVGIGGGKLTLSSDDDGIHADNQVNISGGTVDILKSFEAVEGLEINVSGGNVSFLSSDDGFNAGGGSNAGNNTTGRPDSFASGQVGSINISGGKIIGDAGGDGIDSKGSIKISGGEVYVAGPENEVNGAMDYDAQAEITGGIFVATGKSGMAQNFSQATQGSALVTVAQTNQKLTLKNADGEILVEFSPEKNYNSAVVSCPQMALGNSYTLTCGSSSQTISLSSYLYGGGAQIGGGAQKPGRI